MAFNSFVFLLIFVPIVVVGYWQLKGQTLRLFWLTAASLVFYAYADWHHALLMVGVTVLGHHASRRLVQAEAKGARRFWLWVSMGVFLLPLGAFKYFDFAALTTQSLLSLVGLEVQIPLLELALPLGISFYTFKAMSYCLDLYHRRTEPAPTLLRFLAYVSLFPQLIAGPISRYRDLGTQLAALPPRLERDHVTAGAYLLVLGLAKKVLIADRLASFVDPLLADHASLGFFGAWGGMLGYSLQLYLDFSGYSDMAVGLGHFFGLALPRNFENPYRAENVGAFWNRWHITLSHWFRDYLFFPVSRDLMRWTGRRRPEAVRTTAHLFTMGLVGLWHGAAWTYILWGLYHGALLAGYSWLRARNRLFSRVWVNRATTLALVVVGWAIFRSESAAQLGNMLAAMGGLRGFEAIGALPSILGFRLVGLIALGLGLVFLAPDSWEVPRSTRRWAEVALGALLFITMLAMGETITFLYRQF